LSDTAPVRPWLRLRISDVENAFTQVTIDLKEILVLDGIGTCKRRLKSEARGGRKVKHLVRDYRFFVFVSTVSLEGVHIFEAALLEKRGKIGLAGWLQSLCEPA